MKMSAKIAFNKNICSYLAVTDCVQLNWRNDEWEWWSMKVSASKMYNDSNHTNIAFNWEKSDALPFCYQWCLIESKIQWTRGMTI